MVLFQLLIYESTQDFIRAFLDMWLLDMCKVLESQKWSYVYSLLSQSENEIWNRKHDLEETLSFFFCFSFPKYDWEYSDTLWHFFLVLTSSPNMEADSGQGGKSPGFTIDFVLRSFSVLELVLPALLTWACWFSSNMLVYFHARK